MYCKKCGTEIDDDAIFCSKCGEKQKSEEDKSTDNLTSKEIEKIINEEDEKSKNGCFPFVIGFIILLIIGITFIVHYITEYNEENPNSEIHLTSRDATNSDIEVDCETNLSELGINIIIVPNTDIDGLKIKLSHYDKNGNLLKVQTKSIGNVKEGIEIERTISITEFSISDMLKIYQTKVEVTEGTVKYFN